MSDRLIGLELLDSFLVRFYVLCVDFVLGSGWVEGAQFEEDLDRSLVFCGSEAFGAFSLKLDGFFRVFYRERF
jgi:hypothetical protein